MSMDDDLFNVPENDEEMMDGNEEDEELDENNGGYENENDNDNEENEDNEDNEDNEENENDDDDDDDDNEEGDGDDNEEDDEDDEANEDEDEDDDENDNNDANDNENEENGIEDDNDETKFLDAKEDQDASPDAKVPIERNKDDNSNTEEMNGHQTDTNDGDNDKEKDPDAMAVDEEGKPEIPLRETIIERAKAAEEFDIVPTMAIPYSSQCHAIAFTDGPKWIITGGEDGFIRKYDFMESIQGKSPLTMAQKHNLVDSITKAGIINSYWENEQPLTKKQVMAANPKIKPSDFSTGSINYEPKVNPVYALDVERNGYWCLSGVLSGGISLYTMRYSEGTLQHYFRHGPKRKSIDSINGHNDAVSALKLNSSQDKFLSGAWDRAIRQWDLNTGACTNLFMGSTGQISNIQYRPLGLTDLTMSFDMSTGDEEERNSDMGSLFGDSDNENNNEQKEKKNRDDDDKELRNKKAVLDNSKMINKVYNNDNIFMSSCSDGTVNIWDVRTGNSPVIKYGVPEKTPPWCMSSTWSNCGDYIYVGRRNSTVDEFSIKMPHKRNINNKSIYSPNVLKRLQFPKISGPVTALSTMPNNDFLLCGSMDNIRLYNLKLYNSEDPTNVTSSKKKTQATPFLIVPGHHGGVLSSLYVDPTGRFMVSASGNRGWGNANHTDTVLVYEIDFDY